MYIILILSIHILYIYNKIIIRSPLELAKKFPNKTIKINLSKYGKIPYGQKIIGKLYYDDSINNKLSCEKLSMNIPDNPKVDESPFILIENGHCGYYIKLNNIQESKGHLAIIINDKPNENISNIIINEPRGNEIIIPGMIISYEDGEIIKNYIKDNINKNIIKDIIFEINIQFENINNIVYYDLFYTPEQENAYIFFNEIEKYDNLLNENAILRIHPVTYIHSEYNSNNKIKKNNCFSSGKYCILSNNNIKGEDKLKESIRQKCIYQYLYENNSREKKSFFKYMNDFYNNCIINNEINKECISKINYQKEIIEKCYFDSFIGTNDEKNNNEYDLILDNKILNDDYKNFHPNLINRIPSLTINGRLYIGPWKGDYIFDSLCSSFLQKPNECNIKLNLSYSFYKIGSIILLILTINVFIYLICKKFLKNKIQENVDSTDINTKINTFINSFLALKDRK